MNRYVDVILPLPLPGCFTYSLAEQEERVSVGCRVVVPFGKKKFYTAIVQRIHNEKPSGYEVKEIFALLDSCPVLLSNQLRLWQWIADYYLCALGEVYKAAIPSGLKLESETIIELNPDYEASERLSDKEQLVLGRLMDKPEQRITELTRNCGEQTILRVVNRLLALGAVTLKEQLRQGYKPLLESRIRLNPLYRSEEKLNALFSTLQRTPRQQELLLRYIELSGFPLSGHEPLKEVSKKQLLDSSGASAAVLNGLLEKGILELHREEIGRLRASGQGMELRDSSSLNGAQQQALDAILAQFSTKNVSLLHGVTSSGKTEIYIQLIRKAMEEGKQVLYLLPEIALTTQITKRLRSVFGARLGIYHSKFSDAERVEIWQKQLSDEPYELILGVRSSLFLPFHRLGLVIVDEEHEASYKQQEPAPRYHARNTAIMLATMAGAKTLLGTATPSIESWHNATTGKYGWAELKERYSEVQLPEIVSVDVKELKRKKRMSGQFSPLLLQSMREALESGEQVILFQNRRGYAPMTECRTCGWVPKCRHCDVSLTYHRGFNQLVCHYCGSVYPVPKSCPACFGTELSGRGFGTERVEEEIKVIFPEATVARLDLDTARTRSNYEKILAAFEQGKTQILIGTQMISKGLDFDHVSVVGILNADSMLNYPDFRSYERAYQLMAQVAGRAGRREKRGQVILQTNSPDHPIIHQVIANNYEEMAAGQLAERQLFRYPPFYRLVYVYLKGRDEALLDQTAITMGARLRQVFGDRVLGPDKPPVARVQSLFIRKLVLKIEQQASMDKARGLLLMNRNEEMANATSGSVQIYYDVDPM
jgi:primosomal protein N' (replication factor Y)